MSVEPTRELLLAKVREVFPNDDPAEIIRSVPALFGSVLAAIATLVATMLAVDHWGVPVAGMLLTVALGILTLHALQRERSVSRLVGDRAADAFFQHKRQRPRPERLGEPLGCGVEHRETSRGGDIEYMRDQRIERRPALGRE